jgi:hypothetical protein
VRNKKKSFKTSISEFTRQIHQLLSSSRLKQLDCTINLENTNIRGHFAAIFKVSHCENFTNILGAAFAPKSFNQKLQTQIVTT